ncbi:Protein GRISEA [Penicillium digitatum PHI26]|uniref:Protein GRISEA n=2 Tax=Penicillium digitatum TaxID=36651 RepID=K9FYW4_PEND2|nr:Protein GRISEA [Penicillium digitatum Pd1]EKV06236.1 Protein GRISEA [Penicillium digitatum PHI26]EKV18670.1 Protein GRISEA [Penicillium digitatum Pd1]
MKKVPSGPGRITPYIVNGTGLKSYTSEPCIRGHRSSKCQHFDRLMMKVPKAGRPLAKCPHPKGTCSCQKTYAVMVRIPKGTCLPPHMCLH